MADAGISPTTSSSPGTANVGEYFKAQDTFGTIAAGQRADLILVDANPLQNLTNMEKRSGVMVRGRWLPAVGDRRTAGEDRRCAMRRPMFPTDSYPLARRDILTLAGLASISPASAFGYGEAGLERAQTSTANSAPPARALRAARRPPGARPPDRPARSAARKSATATCSRPGTSI